MIVRSKTAACHKPLAMYNISTKKQLGPVGLKQPGKINRTKKVLIIGLGNYLAGDEGVGVHATRRLLSMQLPNYVDVLDGGPGSSRILKYFKKYKKVILINAALDGKKSGRIKLMQPKSASDFPRSMSVHDTGLGEIIRSLELQKSIPDIYLFSVSIEYMRMHASELTDGLQAVMPRLLKKIIALCNMVADEKKEVSIL